MYFTIMDDDRAFGETLKNKLESEYHAVVDVYHGMIDLDQIKHVPDILFLYFLCFFPKKRLRRDLYRLKRDHY